MTLITSNNTFLFFLFLKRDHKPENRFYIFISLRWWQRERPRQASTRAPTSRSGNPKSFFLSCGRILFLKPLLWTHRRASLSFRRRWDQSIYSKLVSHSHNFCCCCCVQYYSSDGRVSSESYHRRGAPPPLSRRAAEAAWCQLYRNTW